MILGAEIGLLLYGLYALVKGEFKLSKTRIARGSRARIAAIFLLLPLPLSFAVGYVLGATGNAGNLDTSTLALIEIVILLICGAIAFVIASTAPQETPSAV